MNDLSAVGSKAFPHYHNFELGLIPLLCLHIVTCCVSLAFVASSYPDVVAFDSRHLFAALLIVIPFSVVAILFTIAPFSFGYFLGFYFYTMILGYLWLIEFSKTLLRSPSGNCFNLPLRAGVSCACLVYNVPDQPTICLDGARPSKRCYP